MKHLWWNNAPKVIFIIAKVQHSVLEEESPFILFVLFQGLLWGIFPRQWIIWRKTKTPPGPNSPWNTLPLNKGLRELLNKSSINTTCCSSLKTVKMTIKANSEQLLKFHSSSPPISFFPKHPCKKKPYHALATVKRLYRWRRLLTAGLPEDLGESFWAGWPEASLPRSAWPNPSPLNSALASITEWCTLLHWDWDSYAALKYSTTKSNKYG